MTTITGHSSLLVTQNAIQTALTSDATFPTICGGPLDTALLNPASQINQAFPYVAFGDHVETNWYQFQNPSKQIDFIIHIYSQQSYQETMTILDVINSVIEAKTLNLLGGNFTNATNGVMFLSAKKIPEPDDITRHIEGSWHIWNNAN